MGKVNYYSTEEIKINSKQISLPFLKICLLYFSNIIEQAYTIVITNEYNMISLLESPNFITVESPLIINLVFKRMSKIITLFYCSHTYFVVKYTWRMSDQIETEIKLLISYSFAYSISSVALPEICSDLFCTYIYMSICPTCMC